MSQERVFLARQGVPLIRRDFGDGVVDGELHSPVVESGGSVAAPGVFAGLLGIEELLGIESGHAARPS